MLSILFRKIHWFGAALALLVLPVSSFADWTLDKVQSQLNFISIKKSAVAEIHGFKQLDGNLSSDGRFEVGIDLASVATNIPIRDERMRGMLFEVGKFPLAKITGVTDLAPIKALSVGGMADLDVEVNLSLHGKSESMKGRVRVVRLDGSKLLVSTLQPMIVNAANFDLAAGIEKLREVAKLPAISTAVPVTFSLVFSPSAADAPKGK